MNRKLQSELKGIIGLLKDFKSEALLPVFEAVVNSIQAIEDRFGTNVKNGTIKISIIRSAEVGLPFKKEGRKEPEIISFVISDNGIGFTDENLESFMTVASSYKERRGGKGIGRFTWLKAFESVVIDSVFEDSNHKKILRKIVFSLNGIFFTDNETELPIGTNIQLNNFKKKYKSLPSACRTTTKIAQRIMEHCLFYFIADKNPVITIEDNRPEKIDIINLQQMYDNVKEQMVADSLQIANQVFCLYHMKLYGTRSSMHNIVLCANNRDVTAINMTKLIGTNSQFDDNNKKFTYAVYVSGEYLDKHVDATRTDFDLPDEGLFCDSETPIAKDKLQNEIAEKAKIFLADYLKNIENRRQEIVQKYVSEQNPALRSVLMYCPEAIAEIEPTTQEEKIDEILYKYKGKAEFEIKKQSTKLLKTQKTNTEDFVKNINIMSSKLEDFQKDNLAGYMLFRKFIIELLDKKISMSSTGTFEKEKIIHDIFFPRKTTSSMINYENHNLWLLDERLTFHTFAASDLPLNNYMDTQNDDRPDVVAFSDIDEETRVAKSVSVIELKKPQRKEFDESPIAQMLRMVKGIKEGQIVLQSNGRPLQVSISTRFYCYGVLDFTKKVKEFAADSDYIELNGELGYFNYHSQHKASIFLINFDKIVADAKKRHYAFFEKLGVK